MLGSSYSRKGPAGGCQGLLEILFAIFGLGGLRKGGAGEGQYRGGGEGRRMRRSRRSVREMDEEEQVKGGKAPGLRIRLEVGKGWR